MSAPATLWGGQCTARTRDAAELERERPETLWIIRLRARCNFWLTRAGQSQVGSLDLADARILDRDQAREALGLFAPFDPIAVSFDQIGAALQAIVNRGAAVRLEREIPRAQPPVPDWRNSLRIPEEDEDE